jgi:hypothetical protein
MEDTQFLNSCEARAKEEGAMFTGLAVKRLHKLAGVEIPPETEKELKDATKYKLNVGHLIDQARQNLLGIETKYTKDNPVYDNVKYGDKNYKTKLY